MADSSKIRLVRCPECGNLLQEYSNYSVYQCGGCNTVFKAKKKLPVSERIWEKFNEENNSGCDHDMNFNRSNFVSHGLHGIGVSCPMNSPADSIRYSPLPYPNEGPSNFRTLKNSRDPDIWNQAEFVANMNELKKQIRVIEEKAMGSIGRHAKSAPLESYGNRVAAAYDSAREPLAFNQSRGPACFRNDNEFDDARSLYHPSRHFRNEVQGFRQPHQKCRQPPPCNYCWGRYDEPTCSCLQCYDRGGQVPHVSSSHDFDNLSLEKGQLRSNCHHCSINPVLSGPQNSEALLVNHALMHSQELEPLRRWPINIDSDGDEFNQSRQRKVVVVADGNRRICHPIAGGAPFITCCHCLELLQLPRKLIKPTNTLQKLQCGTCSFVYSIQTKNKMIFIPVPTKTKRLSGKDCNTSQVTLNEGALKSQGCLESTDNKHDSILSESNKRQSYTSASLISTDSEETFAQPNSPLSAHTDETSYVFAPSDLGKENRSRQTNQVNFTHINNTVDVCSKEDKKKINKGRKALLLLGLVKKSFQDIIGDNKKWESERYNVLVNGQLLPDHLVKKAEKLAGPIHPGDYWYDFRAGFWGVIGQPCLGIITPFIEEFNYPMPENCAAGNTDVFVNGRELHQTDFDILVNRGLPNTRNKNYIVEFSGRVLDEDSGTELNSLGKLAPTVESVNRGFGMRVPEFAL